MRRNRREIKKKIKRTEEKREKKIRGGREGVRKTERVKQERGQEVTIKGKGTCTGA